MTITVSAPTGHIGARVVELLVQAGVRPRVLCRDPGRLAAGLRDHVEVVRGDLADPEYVLGATKGSAALFCVVPEDFTLADPLAAMREIASGFAAAVAANGIGRVVLISSVGAERGTGTGLIDGLAAAETELRATGADVLALRCGYLFTNLHNDLRDGSLTTTMPADRPVPWVDPRDIGDIAAARLLSPEWSGPAVQAVHGPVDLSWSQVAALLGEVRGEPVHLNVVSDDELRAALSGAGLAAPAVEGIVGMTAGLRDGFVPEQPRSAVTTTPTTLRSWACEQLRQLQVQTTGRPTPPV